MGSMGLFRTTIEVESLERRGERLPVAEALVDTGSELTWVPRATLEALGVAVQRTMAFLVADGRRVERAVGYALVRAGGTEAPDFVVFAEPGDRIVLGWRSLIPAGPIIAASAA